MKILIVTILLYSSALLADSFNVEAIHLKNGTIVTADDDSYVSEEIHAIEIKDVNQSLYLVTPKTFDKIFGTNLDSREAVRIGGDGSGGG